MILPSPEGQEAWLILEPSPGGSIVDQEDLEDIPAWQPVLERLSINAP